MDVKTSSGKAVFNMVHECKNLDHTEGNAAIDWERLKNKYEPTSAPSLVKQIGCLDRAHQLKTILEELRMKLEDMGSVMTNDQFMIHALS
jgi:hypothetical protein